MLSDDRVLVGTAGTIRGGDFQSPSSETATKSRRHLQNASRSIQIASA